MNKLTKVIGKAEAQLGTVNSWSAGHRPQAKNCRTRRRRMCRQTHALGCMPTTTIPCPSCQTIAQAQRVWEEMAHVDGRAMVNVALQCTNCGIAVGGLMDGNYNLVRYWPNKPMIKQFPDVPEHIAQSATEVHACLSIGAQRAAIGLARAVVEATAKDHGIQKGNLENKIEAMARNGVIGPDTSEATHAIRLWGNDAAHGDLALEEFADEDAQEVVALMDDVLNRAYQSKAKVGLSSGVQRVPEARPTPGLWRTSWVVGGR